MLARPTCVFWLSAVLAAQQPPQRIELPVPVPFPVPRTVALPAPVKAANQGKPATPTKPRVVELAPGLRLLELRGNPFERGEIHGREFREEIRATVAKWQEDLRTRFKLEPAEFITRFRERTSFERAIKDWTPGLLDEVRGIAKGSGVDFASVYAFQLVDEIWAQGDAIAAVAHKCTVVGVDRHGSSPALLGQNLDLPPLYHGTRLILRLVDEKKRVQAHVLTVPGLVGALGLSSAGFGVGVNTLLQLRSRPDGLPVAFVVRGILAEKDWWDARQFLFRVHHASGQSYTLGGPDVVHTFECSARRVTRVSNGPGLSRTWHTNLPLGSDDWTDELLGRAEKAGKPPRALLPECPRLKVLDRRLAPVEGVIPAVDVEALCATLSSREDAKAPVCNPWTFATSVMVLRYPDPELHLRAKPDQPFTVLRFPALPNPKSKKGKKAAPKPVAKPAPTDRAAALRAALSKARAMGAPALGAPAVRALLPVLDDVGEAVEEEEEAPPPVAKPVPAKKGPAAPAAKPAVDPKKAAASKPGGKSAKKPDPAAGRSRWGR
ncbi:MAG: hypothetical protein KDC87_18700 [Planctomycetes bacterium]|nr:hypothetical protein [Planctomycetota bacterium]MCB9871280.1 hypothetical protein [Planctomycetota bacterium]